MKPRLEQQWSSDRREFLLAVLAGSAGSLLGCQPANPQISGELLGQNVELGHRLRDRTLSTADVAHWEQTETVIVGAGIAGLSAAWWLHQSGQTDFRVLELESVAGGTSRSETTELTAYPWGAHYVPLPRRDNRLLLQLFQEMGAVSKKQQAGSQEIIWQENEGAACREPQERLFVAGDWHEGLYPHALATKEDQRQWNQFQKIIHDWIDWRDPQGRRAFTIPLAECSTAVEVTQLDQLTASQWLDNQQLTSAPLRWLVDYCCRDDYGLTSEQTSAWAAIFYFASRLERSGIEEPALLTWPAGNGHIVNYLARLCGQRLETGRAVFSIRSTPATDQTEVLFYDVSTKTVHGIRARQVIFAAPQFLTPHLIPELPDTRRALLRNFSYGAWVVANLHLSGRPRAGAYPLCWDNVLHESPSLGYVVATHQTGSDYGPSVWTWYLPLCDLSPQRDRQRLLNANWEEWAGIIQSDLKQAHPDLLQYLQRIDVFRWGHAMIQPRPGFVWGPERQAAALPVGNIHFAGTDLSGVALMEEAFYHGVRAAREVLQKS